MRRLCIIILCGLCGWMSVQAQYRIFAHSGNIECKNKTNQQWMPISDGMEIASNDSLYIEKESSVRIMHIQKGMVYKTEFNGRTTVGLFVKKAQNEYSDRVMARVNVEIKTGNKSPGVRPIKRGGSARATLSDNSQDLEQLADMFAWIGAQACKGENSPQEPELAFVRNKVGDELDFIYYNTTEKDYYMNVLHVNKLTNVVSLCYVIRYEESYDTCPITPTGTCSCSMDFLFPDTENDIYILVATETPYDTNALDSELMWHPTTTAKGSDMNVKYIW